MFFTTCRAGVIVPAGANFAGAPRRFSIPAEGLAPLPDVRVSGVGALVAVAVDLLAVRGHEPAGRKVVLDLSRGGSDVKLRTRLTAKHLDQ